MTYKKFLLLNMLLVQIGIILGDQITILFAIIGILLVLLLQFQDISDTNQ